MITINVYCANMTETQIQAIADAVNAEGFDVVDTQKNITGCAISIEGSYYGNAVTAINALGYETDEDEG